MIPLWLAFILSLVGGFSGYYLRKSEEETCPRIVAGWNCKGYVCDHSEAMLRRAQLDVALRKENEPDNYNFKP